MYSTVSFIGYNHRKKLVRDAIWWFLPKYVGRHVLDIEIHDKRMNREGTDAACMFSGYSRPRQFFIEMNNSLDNNEYLKGLFHELIHLKQWVLRQRVTTKDNKDYWYGKQIDDNVAYMDLPWEKEAYSREDTVFNWYLKSQEYNRV